MGDGDKLVDTAASRDQMPSMNRFGEVLSNALRARRISQKELARRLSRPSSAVSQWATGVHTPKPATVARIEEILELEPGTLSEHLTDVWSEEVDDDLFLQKFTELLSGSRLTDTEQTILRDLVERFLEGPPPTTPRLLSEP